MITGNMEIPPPNDRYHQASMPQRWRASELLAYSQQMSPGVLMNPSGDSKFVLDDTVLSDLMDLDPLCDQTGEPWVAAAAEYGLPFMAFSPNFSPTAMSPLNSSPSLAASHHHHVFSQANSSLAMCAQLSPGDYLVQEILTPSPPRVHESLDHPQQTSSSDGYLAAVMSPGSQENFAEMSQFFLNQQVAVSSPSPLDGGGGGADRLVISSGVAAAESNGGPTTILAPANRIEVLEEDFHPQMSDPMFKESDGGAGAGGSDMHFGVVATNQGSRKRYLVNGNGMSLRERMMQALRYIGRSCTDVLAQVWMPVPAADDRIVLSTREQPYVLEHKTDRLSVYRTVSERIDFAVSGGSPGLPGRVFLQQVPEWTPNVQFYSIREYLRVKEAQKCDVRGTLAVPVFEATTRKCLAVIELVMRAEKVQYAPEIDIICRALQVCEIAPHYPYSSLK